MNWNGQDCTHVTEISSDFEEEGRRGRNRSNLSQTVANSERKGFIFKKNCAMIVGANGDTKLLANGVGDLNMISEKEKQSCCVTSAVKKNSSNSSNELEKWLVVLDIWMPRIY